jgi:hypothetical protein
VTLITRLQHQFVVYIEVLILSLEMQTMDKSPEYPSPPTRLSIAQSVVIAGVLLAAVGAYDAWATPTQIAPPLIQTTLNEYNEYRIVVVQPPSTQLPIPPDEASGRCYSVDADCLSRMRGHRLTPEQQEAMRLQTEAHWCRDWDLCRGW